MRERFRMLERVPGVRGVIAAARESSEVLYASDRFGDVATSAAALSMRRVLEELPSSVLQLTATFAGGAVIVFLMQEHLLILSVDEKFRTSVLRDHLHDTARREPAEQPDADGSALERGQLDVLLDALAHLVRQARSELGTFVTANALREGLRVAQVVHPKLSGFSINPEARILGGFEGEVFIAEACLAFASWGRSFFARCNEIVPTFTPELAISLMEGLRPQLRRLGFYRAWAETIQN